MKYSLNCLKLRGEEAVKVLIDLCQQIWNTFVCLQRLEMIGVISISGGGKEEDAKNVQITEPLPNS